MKKLLLLVMTVLLISCSSSDNGENSGGNNSNSFHPPSWIQGRWLDADKIDGVGFKSDDFCYLFQNQDYCNKSGLINASKVGVYTNVSEEKTDSYYKFNFTINSSTFYFHFVKVSNNQIKEIVNDPNGYDKYTKQ